MQEEDIVFLIISSSMGELNIIGGFEEEEDCEAQLYNEIHHNREHEHSILYSGKFIIKNQHPPDLTPYRQQT